MNTLHIQGELSRAISLIELQNPKYYVIETNYPQKLWISRDLTNVESSGRSRLEVDWLFFAQDDSVTDSRYPYRLVAITVVPKQALIAVPGC
jgi:hypothetical protein